MTCKQCKNFHRCMEEAFHLEQIFDPNYDGEHGCLDFSVLTNADRIRAMSDEELMHLLFNKISCGSVCAFCVPTMRTGNKCDGHCRNGVLKWLKQPAESGDNDVR